MQRNKLFVKCSFTNQSSSLKLIDCSNVSMFVRLQISFWNTCSRNTGDWNTSYKNTSFWNTSFRNTCNWNTELIFVTNITNYIRGEKIVMWRNFSYPCMTIVEKFMEFYCNLCHFFAKSVIHCLFCREIFCHNLRAFMWRKIEPKSTFVEKNDKYEVCWNTSIWSTGSRNTSY